MLARLFEVKNSGNKGKGLFAKESIPKGTIVSFECQDCIRISKDDFEFTLTNKEKSLILKYSYRKADGSYLLPCDKIIYLNHSCNANILDSGKGFDIVVKDISKGEEATYDYRSFFFHDSNEFECMCGEDNCCKIVGSVHDQHNPQRFELMKIWKRSVNDALICSGKVDQPLNDKLPHVESSKWTPTTIE
jgi:SET domain-containing protein